MESWGKGEPSGCLVARYLTWVRWIPGVVVVIVVVVSIMSMDSIGSSIIALPTTIYYSYLNRNRNRHRE